jgi:hypothetical protein
MTKAARGSGDGGSRFSSAQITTAPVKRNSALRDCGLSLGIGASRQISAWICVAAEWAEEWHQAGAVSVCCSIDRALLIEVCFVASALS